MRSRTTLAAAAAAACLLVTGAHAASAHAATTPLPSTLLTFVPPSVGPLHVDIGPTIINGQVIDPGLHVVSPGITLPPITWTLPSFGSWTPGG
jgi:hypothetical protein